VDASREKLEFVKAHEERLKARLLVGAPSRDIADIATIEFDKLPAGFVRTYLEANAAYVRWQRCRQDSDEESTSRKQIESLVKTFPAVMQEQYLIGIAEHLYQQRKYDESKSILDRLPEPSRWSESLQYQIKQKLQGLP